MESKFLDQRKCWLLLGAFIAASILFFFDSLNTPFFSDDFYVIRRLANENFDAVVFFRPLGDLSLYVDWKLFGNNPFWFHLHNIILHGIASFAVVLVVYQIQKYLDFKNTYPISVAVLSGFLFLIYPFHTEPVVWVVGRGIILSALWVCLSLVLFCRYGTTKGGYCGSLFCFAISLLGYETAAILPLLIFLLVFIWYKKIDKALLISSGYFIVVVFFLLARYLAMGNIVEPGNDYFRIGAGFPRYIYNLIALLARSAGPPFFDTNIFVVVGAVIFFVLLFVLYRLKRLQPLIFVHTLCIMGLFLLALLPVITVGIDTHDYEGGRFLYLPSIFFCFLISFVLINSKMKKTIRVAVIVFISAGYFYFLYEIKSDWKSAGRYIAGILKPGIKFSKKNYFMSVPDNKNGAYIFRNGLEDALVMNHLIPDSDSVKILSFSEVINGTIGDSLILKNARKVRGEGWQLDMINKTLRYNRGDDSPQREIDLNHFSISVFVFRDSGFIRIYPSPEDVKP